MRYYYLWVTVRSFSNLHMFGSLGEGLLIFVVPAVNACCLVMEAQLANTGELFTQSAQLLLGCVMCIRLLVLKLLQLY